MANFIEEKIQKAMQKINGGDRSGSFVFDTKKELCQYLELSEGSYKNHKNNIRNAGFCFSVRVTDVEKKIQNAKERIEGGDRNGSFTFDSIKELCEYLGASRGAYREYKEKLYEVGFFIDGSSTDSLVRSAKKKIENGDRDGSFVFESIKELCIYIGIGEATYYRNKQIIDTAGFHADCLAIEERIRSASDRINSGDRGGSFVFGSVNELYEYLGASKTTYYRNEQKIAHAGFCVETPTVEQRLQAAEEKINSGDRGGSFVFESVNELCEYINIGRSAYYDCRDKIDSAGFSFVDRSIEEKIQSAKNRIGAGDRDGSFSFETVKKLFEYLGITETSYYRYQQKIYDAGFSIDPARTISSLILAAKEKINKGARNGNLVFKSKKELCEFLEVKEGTYRKYKEKIHEEGFIIQSAEISKNMLLSIEDCRAYNIKMESIELLPLLSRDFFSRSISGEIGRLNKWDDYNKEITFDFAIEEIFTRVKAAVLNLIADDKSDYSMLELKLELFASGVYLSEESIINALIAQGENVNEVLADNIRKRLRLCVEFAKKKLAYIEYVEKLPLINNSEEGTVIVDKSIGDKKSFMALWKEYVLFLIKNDIAGHVSKTKLPNGWKGSLESLFEQNPSYQKAFFLDEKNKDLLEEMGYEGILAMCQFGARQSKKNFPKMYHSVQARCMGFFLFLNRKKLALFHPKYLNFTGASSVSRTAKEILKGHVVLDGFERVLEAEEAPEPDLKKLQKKNVFLHALKLACSIMEGCDLKAISPGDIYSYLEHSAQEAVSGTIQHETFVLSLFRLLGNRGAIVKNKVFDIEAEINKFIVNSKANNNTLSRYKDLLREMLDVARHIFNEGKTLMYVKSHLNQIFNLMNYLSIFPQKLNRQEMSEALNTVIKATDRVTFEVWAKTNITRPEYLVFTQRMYVIFDQITNKEYSKLYHREWRIFKRVEERALIREGMDPIAYETLQRVALYDPPTACEYPFYRTTPDGEEVDLSWWKFDFSPVPVICNWLIIKTTRRKVAVRHLDVNTFMQYESGQLRSLFFNTDKNRGSQDREISIHLLKFIFTDEELRLLEKYVVYIKRVFPNMAKVSYGSSANSFEDIMPLFPHHSKNAVIDDSWVDGYFNKTMLKTELLLKKYVSQGEYDRYFEEHERETKKQMLSETKLLKESSTNKTLIPAAFEEIDQCSLAAYRRNFTTTQGIHNMRHAGISALGAKLPLVYVRIIAGHSDINTTLRVYFHASENIIEKEVLNTDIGSLSEPAKTGDSFVRIKIVPLIESNDPKRIEEELLDNNFMSCPREATVSTERKRIENGIEIASGTHPASWTIYNHGICPNAQCPPESRGCCGLCPFFIFSPMHIKGIIYQVNKCLIDMSLISQKIAKDATKNINTSREELNLRHQQKVEEMVGWSEVMNRTMEKINLISSADKNTSLPVNITADKRSMIVPFQSCSIDESMVGQLVDAAKLKIDNEETDNYIARLSHKIVLTAIKNYDSETLKKIEDEGIRWFIDEYGKKAFQEKKDFLLQYISADNFVSSPTAPGINLRAPEPLLIQ